MSTGESTGEQQDNDHKKEDISSSYGPSLPPDMTDQSHNTYGPQLPSSHLLPKDQYGPSLPKDQYGPSLPKDQYGPSLPKDQYSPSLPPTDQYGPSVSSIASRHDDPSNLINTGSTGKSYFIHHLFVLIVCTYIQWFLISCQHTKFRKTNQ